MYTDPLQEEFHLDESTEEEVRQKLSSCQKETTLMKSWSSKDVDNNLVAPNNHKCITDVSM